MFKKLIVKIRTINFTVNKIEMGVIDVIRVALI